MTYQSAPALRIGAPAIGTIHRDRSQPGPTTPTGDVRTHHRPHTSGRAGAMVLKGGMALEVRLRNDARLTKDVDLGLRDDVNSAPDLHERLVDILAVDLPGGPKSARNWP